MSAAEAENAMEAVEAAENAMGEAEVENAIEAAETEEGKSPATEIEGRPRWKRRYF